MQIRISIIALIKAMLFICIATYFQLRSGILWCHAEESPANNNSSASKTAVELNKKIYILVKELQYSDDVAQGFIQMVRTWKCETFLERLSQAKHDEQMQIISKAKVAQIEEDIIKSLARMIAKEIVSDSDNSKYFDLDLVIIDKKAQCLGYCQIFCILANSIGLNTKAIEVLELSDVPLPVYIGHMACAVGLCNGKGIIVDLQIVTLDNF
jgi:hypothetical protein